MNPGGGLSRSLVRRLSIPATAAFGGLSLATKACGVLIHVFVIGGDATPAVMPVLMVGTMGWS